MFGPQAKTVRWGCTLKTTVINCVFPGPAIKYVKLKVKQASRMVKKMLTLGNIAQIIFLWDVTKIKHKINDFFCFFKRR